MENFTKISLSFFSSNDSHLAYHAEILSGFFRFGVRDLLAVDSQMRPRLVGRRP